MSGIGRVQTTALTRVSNRTLTSITTNGLLTRGSCAAAHSPHPGFTFARPTETFSTRTNVGWFPVFVVRKTSDQEKTNEVDGTDLLVWVSLRPGVVKKAHSLRLRFAYQVGHNPYANNTERC